MQTAQQDQQTRVYQDSLQGQDINTQDIMTILEQNQEYKEQNIDQVFDELETHTWEELGTDVLNDVIMTGLMFGTGALVAKAERHRLVEPVKQYKYNNKLSPEQNIKKLQKVMDEQTKYIYNQADKITYKGFSNSVNTTPKDKYPKYDISQLKHISEKEYMDRLQNISMQQDIMNKQQQEFKQILNKKLEQSLKRNYEGTNTKIRQYNDQIKGLNKQILNLDKEYNKLNADLNNQLLLKDEALKTRETLQNNIDYSQAQMNEIKKQIENINININNKQQTLEKEIEKYDNIINDLSSKLDINDYKYTNNKLEFPQIDKKATQQKRAKIKQTINQAKNNKLSTEEALNIIKDEYNQQLKDLEAELKSQQAKLEAHNKDYASLEEKINNLNAEQQRLKNELELKEQQKTTIEENQKSINNTNVLKDFKALTDKYMNFGNNAKQFTQDDSFIFTFDDGFIADGLVADGFIADEPRVVKYQQQNKGYNQGAEGQNNITIDQLIDIGLPQLKKQLSSKKGYDQGQGFVAKQDVTYKQIQENLHRNQYAHRDQQMNNIVERTKQFQEETNEMLKEFNDIQKLIDKLDQYNISPELPHIDDHKYNINKSSYIKQKNIQTYTEDVDKYLQDFKTKSYTNNVSDQARKNIQNLQNTLKQTNKADALDINQLWPENNQALKAPSLNEPKSIITQYQDLLKAQVQKEKEIKQYNKKLKKLKQGDSNYGVLNNEKQQVQQQLEEIIDKQQTFLNNMQTIRDKLNKINFEK